MSGQTRRAEPQRETSSGPPRLWSSSHSTLHRVDMNEPTDPAHSREETPEQRRIRTRIGRRLLFGGAIGLVCGLGVGALVGIWWFDRTGAVATSGIAGAIFGMAVGMLVAGYSSLESPDPGKEPSDTGRPVADRPEPTREEHDDGLR